MKKLADISTFNRVCRIVENSERLAPLPDEYNQYRVKLSPWRWASSKDALSDTGRLLMGQQILSRYLYQGMGSYEEYIRRLNTYKKASGEFKNMWASALRHNRCTPSMQKLRDIIANFDASINQFNYELQNNQIYQGNLK